MNQTALEYLRGLANSYAATETVTISVSTLRDALAEKQAVPSTGDMRYLAIRIADECFRLNPSFHSVNAILEILTDAPEIIALQQAKETAERLERLNESLCHDFARLQDENRNLKARPPFATLNIDATMLEAGLQRVKKEILRHIHCRHGIRGDAHCVTCALDAKHEQNMADAEKPAEHDIVDVTEHIGVQGAYDSCNHNEGAQGASCSICEPERHKRAQAFIQRSHHFIGCDCSPKERDSGHKIDCAHA